LRAGKTKEPSAIETHESAIGPSRSLEGYLARLEELKIHGEITEVTYGRLRDEYFARVLKATKTTSKVAGIQKFCRFCGKKIPHDKGIANSAELA
jgi:hypothetical protein